VGCGGGGGNPSTTSYNVDEKFAICMKGYKAVETAGLGYLFDAQMGSSALDRNRGNNNDSSRLKTN
jgi:hypothetical protein